MQVFREGKASRSRRQLGTMLRAVRAGRPRAKSQQAGKPVNGDELLRLLEAVGADVALMNVPVNRPPWTATPITVTEGDHVTWFAWGHVDLIKPLGARLGPSAGFLCRVQHGNIQESGRDTNTFVADRSGRVEVACRFPGWVQEGGSITAIECPTVCPIAP